MTNQKKVIIKEACKSVQTLGILSISRQQPYSLELKWIFAESFTYLLCKQWLFSGNSSGHYKLFAPRRDGLFVLPYCDDGLMVLCGIFSLIFLIKWQGRADTFACHCIIKVSSSLTLHFNCVMLLQERQEAEKMFKGKRGAQLAQDIARRTKT